jgi:alkanesulfonate monooxygenase SsuD/methylene tetrahydromethanopterin reductase-like flavin-dependent oxidoreductase (luciferase family)
MMATEREEGAMGDLRFGINVSPSAEPGSDPVGNARRAEELGFDFVSLNDHLHATTPRHEAWTLLTWIAASTDRVGLLPRVLALPHRNPAVLAKMAETLDRLSGGRLVLGLGGGYADEEFRALGLGTRTPGEKVDALEEGVRVLRGVWSEPFTFEGRFYRTAGADIEPKPERPIPIWLGTLGPRALDLTGRLADGWIPSYENAPPERVPELRDRILRSAEEADRDPAELTLVYNVAIRVDPEPGSDPDVLSGPPEHLAERLVSFAGLGFGAFNLIPEDGVPGQAERLAREVLPIVRADA